MERNKNGQCIEMAATVYLCSDNARFMCHINTCDMDAGIDIPNVANVWSSSKYSFCNIDATSDLVYRNSLLVDFCVDPRGEPICANLRF